MIIALLFLTARADLPPPPGYVEVCTVAIQCGSDTPGKVCSAYHSGREACDALEQEGWSRMCKTAGASVWNEVFCKERPVEAVRQQRIQDARSLQGRTVRFAEKRCGCAAVTPASTIWPLLLVLIGSRRRRAPPLA